MSKKRNRNGRATGKGAGGSRDKGCAVQKRFDPERAYLEAQLGCFRVAQCMRRSREHPTSRPARRRLAGKNGEGLKLPGASFDVAWGS